MAQIPENYKTILLQTNIDTLKYDSLITILSSVFLKNNDGDIINDSLYWIDNVNSKIIFKNSLPDSFFPLLLCYKTFPFSISSVYYNRKLYLNNNEQDSSVNFPINSAVSDNLQSTYYGNLNKSGSVIRGISLGTNKNASLQSAFDLKLEGQLNEDFFVTAAISDRNVPYQPDGNTQQLQEFDKIFINLYNKNTTIIAGDYDLSVYSGFFLKLNKKNQGLWVQHHHKLNKGRENISFDAVHAISGAVAKGKFVQKALNIIDGVQGPYKLSGINNEQFILIIAGSEKIHMNGVLLTRGMDKDYVIDYNTAEITFMPKLVITKNLRIVAEYEYSDRTYARTAFYGSNELNFKKIQFKINYFSEQDMKNQPLLGTITEQQKNFMRKLAENNTLAVFPGFDSVDFSEDYVMYKMTNKTINGIVYDSVFEYSINSDSARYKLSFSYVGRGNGNYIQIRNQANGRVFEWIAPINGVKQGEYEPVIFLNTPQQQQLANMVTVYQISKYTRFVNEMAVSNKDVNTFSPLNNGNNQGYAFRNQLLQTIPLTDSLKKFWKLNVSASQSFIDKNFRTPEPFRNVEYYRDWGIGLPLNANQQDYEFNINISSDKNDKIGLFSNMALFESKYNGIRNGYNLLLYPNNTGLESDGSLLLAKDSLHNIEIWRNHLHLRHNFKWVTLGTRNLFESNRSIFKSNNRLGGYSYENEAYTLYLCNLDTGKHNVMLKYEHIMNNIPLNTRFRKDIVNDVASINYKIGNLEFSTLDLLLSYRNSKIFDSLNRQINNDFGLLNKIEHQLKLKKLPISFYTSVENSSMMEVRYDYSFVEVGTGMGHYIWNDYNGNKIKELYEFEISPIPTEANYIKIVMPTNGYVKVYQTLFSEVINTAFPRNWRSLNGIRGILERFSNQLNIQYYKKTDSKNWNEAYNPFNFQLADSLLKSGRKFIRNTLFFNRASQTFASELAYEVQQNKMLLIDGSEEIAQELYALKNRIGINRNLQMENNIAHRKKDKRSTLFYLKNYSVSSYEVDLKLNYQPNNTMRIAPFSSLSVKEGDTKSSKIKTNSVTYGIESKLSQRFQSSVRVKIAYINVNAKNNVNNPMLFDMIEVFKSGDNYIWSLIYQKSIGQNLQISFTYDGRAAPNSPTFHVGNIMLRAYF